MLRKLGAVPVLLVAAIAGSGWLYLFNPALPGPQIRLALPLDELARHASASLVWFTLIWGIAAVALGLYARWAQIARLPAALLFAVGIGTFSYLQTGVSIAVVRQIAARDAFNVAGRLSAVYLPAAIVAIGAAALAVDRRRARAAAIVGVLVGVGAVLNLLHTVLPGDNGGLLRNVTPDAVGPLARAAGVVVSVALLVAARGLVRRRRRAWQVATVVAAASATLHVLHGINDGTLASVVILTLLLARRHDFDGPGDAATRRVAVQRLLFSATLVVAYAFAALWINRIDAAQPLTFRFALREIGPDLIGLHAAGSPELAGHFGEWFPLSLLLLGVALTLWIAAAWLSPWRHKVLQAHHEHELASALVQSWGVDTLAPFVLRADKSYFFSRDESAFLAYRVVGGVAIVSGDPIGPPEEFDALLDAFVAHAHARDWRVAILGASERWLPLYARHGLHSLYHGDEAVVDVKTFSLDGRAIRKVRQSVHRLERAGYTARILHPSQFDQRLRDELEGVARAWRGSEPERGFVMALDRLFRLGDREALFVVGFGPDGSVTGFLHFAVSAVGRALSLSSMPRLRDSPNGFNEWLICETVAWARENEYERVSLNFAPFAALLAPEAVLSSLQSVQRRALMTLKGHFQLDNLLHFNRKFAPRWERRFVVYERRRDLPRVGVAALAAEAYLPFQGRR
ncbi:MAG TPA: phosphatidylglycerol lysyltransferase domain-containing protein [Gaiellaceae bacterium]|nr:phosphatidylglycerol lysyltransferase domain-containing protein [Gaiellaceae bacterium]